MKHLPIEKYVLIRLSWLGICSLFFLTPFLAHPQAAEQSNGIPRFRSDLSRARDHLEAGEPRAALGALLPALYNNDPDTVVVSAPFWFTEEFHPIYAGILVTAALAAEELSMEADAAHLYSLALTPLSVRGYSPDPEWSAFDPFFARFRSEGGTAPSRGSTSRFEDPAATLLFVTETINADRQAQILLELSDRNLGWHTSPVGRGFNARTPFPRTALRTLAADLEEHTNEPEVVVRLLRRFVARGLRDLQNGATADELSEFGDALALAAELRDSNGLSIDLSLDWFLLAEAVEEHTGEEAISTAHFRRAGAEAAEYHNYLAAIESSYYLDEELSDFLSESAILGLVDRASATERPMAAAMQLSEISGHIEREETIGHERGTVQTVAISPDGRYVVTGGGDGRTIIWSTESGRLIRTLFDEYRGSVVTVRVAPEGNRVLTIFESGPAVVWDFETGRKLFDLGGDESEVVSAVFSRDGTNVVTAAGDGSVVTWDIDSQEALRRITSQSDMGAAIAVDTELNMALSVSSGESPVLWSTESGEEIQRVDGISPVYSAAFTPGGAAILLGGEDGELLLWNIDSGAPVWSVDGEGAVLHIDVDATGTLAAVGTDSGEASIRRIETGERALQIVDRDWGVVPAAFSSDGNLVATGFGDGARLWTADGGEEVTSFESVTRPAPVYQAILNRLEVSTVEEPRDYALNDPEVAAALAALESSEDASELPRETERLLSALTGYFRTSPLHHFYDLAAVEYVVELIEGLIHIDEFEAAADAARWTLTWLEDNARVGAFEFDWYYETAHTVADTATFIGLFLNDLDLVQEAVEAVDFLDSRVVPPSLYAYDLEGIVALTTDLFSLAVRTGDFAAGYNTVTNLLRWAEASGSNYDATGVSLLTQQLFALQALGDHDRIVRRALALRNSFSGRYPASLSLRVGSALLEEGLFREARRTYGETIRTARFSGGTNLRETYLASLLGLGAAMKALGETQEAWNWYQHAAADIESRQVVSAQDLARIPDEMQLFAARAELASRNDFGIEPETIFRAADERLEAFREAALSDSLFRGDDALAERLQEHVDEQVRAGSLILEFSRAEVLAEEGRFPESRVRHSRALDQAKGAMRELLPALTEDARARYLRSAAGFFAHHYTFARAYAPEEPAIAGDLYDTLLFRKDIVLQSVERMAARVEESGDADLIADFDRWRELSEQMATLRRLSAVERVDRNISLEELQAEAAGLESDIARRSAAYRQERTTDEATWQDVQQQLSDGEAAVEMVRFTEGEQIVYAVVALTADDTPRAVFLDHGAEIEEEAYSAYREWVAAMAAGRQSAQYSRFQQRWGGQGVPQLQQLLYRAFWAEIDAALGEEIETIYLSPDGVYNLVNLGILEAPEGQTIGEQRSIRLVTSTRRLIEERRPGAQNPAEAVERRALLLGNPRYRVLNDPPEPVERWVAPIYRGAGTLVPFPGTEEVRDIAATMEEARIPVALLTGEDAGEAELTSAVNSPYILHIATHGFFLEEENAGADPMQNGGLYLAGAQDALTYGGPLPGREEDGILTAREASLLDLRGTELVVLSAGETGLGAVSSGDGVYGLLRGFQAAGARAILVTRWNVPEAARALFMTTFYDRWLAGEPLREAFEAARGELRRRPEYDGPFFWGAFELVNGVRQ